MKKYKLIFVKPDNKCIVCGDEIYKGVRCYNCYMNTL